MTGHQDGAHRQQRRFQQLLDELRHQEEALDEACERAGVERGALPEVEVPDEVRARVEALVEERRRQAVRKLAKPPPMRGFVVRV